jgi:hypothetical protein
MEEVQDSRQFQMSKAISADMKACPARLDIRDA